MNFSAIHGDDNWSIMTFRAQMEQVKLQELSLKNMKSTEDESRTYVLIQSFIEQLPLVVNNVYFMPVIKVITCNCVLKPPLYSNF